MENYEEARKLIERSGDGDFEGPKPEALIALAERRLGLGFPASYRRFLGEYGCGDIEGLEIYGLINENFEFAGVPDAIGVTLKARRNWGLAQTLVIISRPGDGSSHALDTSQTLAGECPVVAFNAVGGAHEQIAESFGDYLLQELKNIL